MTLTHPCLFGVLAASAIVWSTTATTVGSEALGAHQPTPEARSDLGMVATGSPEATRAAVEILERGGNAIDAAVAAALVLGVADSDASGIGGMTYMLVHLADGTTVAVDGSARAPLNVEMAKLRELKKKGRNFGYETVATPTTLATLELARQRFGTRSMAELLQPAIRIAEEGYELSRVQIRWTKKYYDNILAASDFVPYLAMEDGRTIGRAGDRHCQPQMAATLRRIAREGVVSFYRGSIAVEIEADMVANGGYLRRNDLALVRPQVVEPMRTSYRGFEVITFPPPGGGAVVASALHVLEQFPSALLREDSVARHQTLVETFRIAAADGAAAAAFRSPAGWINSPTLSRRHAGERAHQVRPGQITPREALWTAADPECEPDGESTTHVSIADQFGNVVALTQTLSRSFGAKVATPSLGFCYNSLLEAFNVEKPQCPGYLRPRGVCPSHMAPTLVFDEERLVVALGSPGSARIASITALVVSNLIDRRMSLREAVAAPRVTWGGTDRQRVSIEVLKPITATDAKALQAMGYDGMTILTFPPPDNDEAINFGGVNAVGYDPVDHRWVGVVDPRRGGLAEGPRTITPRATR